MKETERQLAAPVVEDLQMGETQIEGLQEIEEMAREIRLIIIHCTATRVTQNYTVDQLFRDHIARGFSDIGYHYYIRKDGELYPCRPENKMGAHCKGFNKVSIGIAYEGGLDANGKPCDTRTEAQKDTMLGLIKKLQKKYPGAKVKGHRDLPGVHKDCPCFDVWDWMWSECHSQEE